MSAAGSAADSAAGTAAADPRRFAALASAGWPAVSRAELDGWELRFSSGVTRRANSARPLSSDPDALLAAFPAVEAAYAERGLPCVLQLAPADAALLPGLAERGYAVAERTLVLAASARIASAAHPDVEISDSPSDAWLACYTSVDGHGDAEELPVLRAIITGVPALYASARDASGEVTSVARLALVGDAGGLYCVATAPSARRQGLARRVLDALFAAGAERGIRSLWLQVIAANSGARALYASYGFEIADGYDYLLQ